MQSGHLLKFIDLFSFVINEHLEKKSLPLLTDKIMHRLIDFNSIFDGTLSCLNQTDFSLVFLFIILLFAKLIELFDSDTTFFHTFLPNFHPLIFSFELSFSIFFFFLHTKDLNIHKVTSESSGIENGLSFCCPDFKSLGRKLLC